MESDHRDAVVLPRKRKGTEYPAAIVPFIPGLEADLWFWGEALDR